jgi:hypothetical protein
MFVSNTLEYTEPEELISIDFLRVLRLVTGAVELFILKSLLMKLGASLLGDPLLGVGEPW